MTTSQTPDGPTPYPLEPPLAATEATQLLASLDRMRATFRWKADDLDAAGLDTAVGASTLTLGRLLKHLALVEDDITLDRLTGGDLTEVWGPLGHDGSWDWQWTSAPSDSPAHLYALYDGAVARARARVDEALTHPEGLDQRVHVDDGQGNHPTLRRLLLDMLEEYGRHVGHADLIREAVDGRVGEDAPVGWVPVSVGR
ncbi:DUF664 domain-containing protein [Nocardioides sp. CFH 31398]|uniref:mycothiol transferase n=1 Tax=Nocardioides sp. CFH 31398 TaxID=2919579 RepID=UPI001F059594|nr:DUF664 domain-containing protein [Nocardioides sp. CFH 31398]MCH1867106.1 DinB family protein [Nocardioides sp. CFH 31398]